jgi:YidC/Oxa1 family membrane protein insertase
VTGAGFLGIEHFTPPWDVFFLPLFNLLIAFYQLPVLDFALAIIVFTIVIRTLLAPLFVRQIQSQREMQRMQPLVREIQRKHKGNRQKITEETMAIYKEHGVNQFGGCLPVLLQLPLLFALYQALIRASSVVNFTPNDAQRIALADWVQRAGLETMTNNNFRVPISGPCDAPPDFASLVPLNCQLIDPIKLGDSIQTAVPWLFNLDLARIDHVFAIPIAGFALSGLAVIAAVLQFVQVKMTSPKPNPDDPTAATTSTMVYLFPLMTIFWGGLFPSGLILYWIVYTGYLVVQQYRIMGWGNMFPVFGWQPRWAPPNEEIRPRPAKSREPEPDSNGQRDTRQPSTNRPGSAPGDGRQRQRSGRRRRRGRKR